MALDWKPADLDRYPALRLGYEVAAALGFDSPANFGKAFKRWYGVSPGNFRSGRRRTVGESR